MNAQIRLATFSLPLLLVGCFLCSLAWTNGLRTVAWSPTVVTSIGLQQPVQSSDTTSSQSSAIDTGPLFPVFEHGKWGYIDKTGKIVISPAYLDAYPFSEGLAFVQSSPDPDPAQGPRVPPRFRSLRTYMVLIDKGLYDTLPISRTFLRESRLSVPVIRSKENHSPFLEPSIDTADCISC